MKKTNTKGTQVTINNHGGGSHGKILDIKHISKHFGGLKTLNQLSFSVDSGCITAIIGPNGSGKSTLFNVISRLVLHDKGSAYFAGKNISLLSDVDVARLGVSRTFQEVRLFRNLTIEDHLQIALSDTDEMYFFSLLRGT